MEQEKFEKILTTIDNDSDIEAFIDDIEIIVKFFKTYIKMLTLIKILMPEAGLTDEQINELMRHIFKK